MPQQDPPAGTDLLEQLVPALVHLAISALVLRYLLAAWHARRVAAPRAWHLLLLLPAALHLGVSTLFLAGLVVRILV